jgi:hypothetical protein
MQYTLTWTGFVRDTPLHGSSVESEAGFGALTVQFDAFTAILRSSAGMRWVRHVGWYNRRIENVRGQHRSVARSTGPREQAIRYPFCRYFLATVTGIVRVLLAFSIALLCASAVSKTKLSPSPAILRE